MVCKLQSKRKPEIRAKLLERDGKNCYICQQPLGNQFNIDHVLPKSLGGQNNISNLRLTHVSCNTKKAATLDMVFTLFVHNPQPRYNMMQGIIYG